MKKNKKCMAAARSFVQVLQMAVWFEYLGIQCCSNLGSSILLGKTRRKISNIYPFAVELWLLFCFDS